MILRAIIGGAWGGMIVGLAEVGLILMTSSPEEHWLLPFALQAYGLAGIAVGAVIGFLLGLIFPGRAQRGPRTFGLAVAAPVVLLGFVVGRYHVVQRIFGEDLAPFSAAGVIVHLILLGATTLIALATYRLTCRLGATVGRTVAAALTLAVVIGVATVVAAALGNGAATAAPDRVATAKGHPNVILIIADTLRADSVARRVAAGREGGFSRLSRDGVRFDQAHAHSTWTRPSVATLVTSLYPSSHGAVGKMDPLPDEVTTVAEVLAAAGYWTAAFVTNINVAPIFNFQQGFGEYHYLEPTFYFGATDSATRLSIYKGLRVLRERLFRDRIYFQNYYQDAVVLTGAASQWLEQSPPRPFFLLVHFMDPHDPYFEIPYDGTGVARVNDPNPPPAEAPRMHALYEEGVDYFDDYLGRMLAELSDRGLYDDTIIALVSDHGEEFQEHGGWWHGATVYEEQLHVPLIIKRAQDPTPGAEIASPATLLDVAPTLVSAAGLEIPEVFQGRDLWGPDAAPRLLVEEDLEGNSIAAVREGSWKLITANPGNPRGLAPLELYDLSSDPDERRNLAEQQPERVAEMLRWLDELLPGGAARN